MGHVWIVRDVAKGFVYDTHSDKFLVVRSLLSFMGRYDLPGGGVHRGEDPQSAFMRELQEETSISAGEVGPIEQYSSMPMHVDYPCGPLVIRQRYFFFFTRFIGARREDAGHWLSPGELIASMPSFCREIYTAAYESRQWKSGDL